MTGRDPNVLALCQYNGSKARLATDVSGQGRGQSDNVYSSGIVKTHVWWSGELRNVHLRQGIEHVGNESDRMASIARKR
jgi:hypothetical protein